MIFSSLPNIITVTRLFLVPLIIALISVGLWQYAFLLFVIAGISDAVDGFLARQFNLRSELGAYLDALADKVLLTSIYVTFAIIGVAPIALALLVVSRDLMIIGAIMISWLLHHPVEIKPVFVSKANTTAQISFAALVLGAKAFGLSLGIGFEIAIIRGSLSGPMVQAYGVSPGAGGITALFNQKQLTFWIIVLFAAGWTVYALSSVMLPFVAGLAVGYLLDPLARRLQRLGLSRTFATILILAFCAVVLVLVGLLLGPVLGRQLSGFLDHLPIYAQKLQDLAVAEANLFSEKYGNALLEKLGMSTGQGGTFDAQKTISDFAGQASQWIASFIRSLISGGAALISLLSLIVITPVVAFYILIDWDEMIGTIDGLLPLAQRSTIHQIAHDIDRALAGFIRGQSLVCLILGLWYGIGLSLIGLNFGFLIGFTAGMLSFIPYVGSLTALVLSLVIAIVQGWPSWSLTLMALAVVGTGQFLEGNVLSPKLVGASVGLHPVWLMFALLAFGSVFGFVGLLIAVPVAAALGVLRLLPWHTAAMIKPPNNRAPRQLPLDLPLKPRFGAEDFLVSSSNDAAYAMMEAWPEWPAPVCLLCGPAGAGKSHLAAIWSLRADAREITARTLAQADPLALVKAPALLIEDIDRLGLEPEAAEIALFHVLNAAKAQGTTVLLTSRLTPDQLPLLLADVRSRLRAAYLLMLGPPDDALLRAVIVKLFVDRQLVVDIGVVEYLALHIERSLDAVQHAVTLLDRQALALGRRITRQMAVDILKTIDETGG
eukprot:gene6289-6361_t